MKKRTLEKTCTLSGVGIHTGQTIHLTFLPAESGHIEFLRADLENAPLRLDVRNMEANNSTSFKNQNVVIRTVEHLLAVLYVFGIDSLLIKLNGDEIPIMDGSALPFVEMVKEGGIRELIEEKRSIRILNSFRIRDNDAVVSVDPSERCRITYTIEYDHPAIQRQSFDFVLDENAFISEIAPARTFGFLKDVPILLSRGLARGGSYDNAVVLDEREIVNGPLRFPDEFVRHKVLDFIGDLSLLERPVLGHFKVLKGGHRIHQKFVLDMLSHPEFWTYEGT